MCRHVACSFHTHTQAHTYTQRHTQSDKHAYIEPHTHTHTYTHARKLTRRVISVHYGLDIPVPNLTLSPRSGSGRLVSREDSAVFSISAHSIAV